MTAIHVQESTAPIAATSSSSSGGSSSGSIHSEEDRPETHRQPPPQRGRNNRKSILLRATTTRKKNNPKSSSTPPKLGPKPKATSSPPVDKQGDKTTTTTAIATNKKSSHGGGRKSTTPPRRNTVRSRTPLSFFRSHSVDQQQCHDHNKNQNTGKEPHPRSSADNNQNNKGPQRPRTIARRWKSADVPPRLPYDDDDDNDRKQSLDLMKQTRVFTVVRSPKQQSQQHDQTTTNSGSSPTAVRPTTQTPKCSNKSENNSTVPANNGGGTEEDEPDMSSSSRQGEQDPMMNHHQHHHIDIVSPPQSCATAILQHSYLELCGGASPADIDETEFSDCCVPESQQPGQEHHDANHKDSNTSATPTKSLYSNNNNHNHNRTHAMPDDPTVQESIECVFASQLTENLALMLQQDDDEDDDDGEKKEDERRKEELTAPSTFQQSLLRNRSERVSMDPTSHPFVTSKQRQTKRRHKKSQESLKLVHVGTYDPMEHPTTPARPGKDAPEPLVAAENADASLKAAPNTPARTSHSTPCLCCQHNTPVVDPERWPQRPLLLRPSPNGGTVVKGIRKTNSSEYLWQADRNHAPSSLTWPAALRESWGKPANNDTQTNPMEVMCPRCMILPINNGNEAPGEALVIDFESELFEGTLLLRMRATEGTTPEPYQDSFGYFSGMNRRYQAVVRGRFKQRLAFTKCMTGFVLDRPCGKLPPKWILKGGLKVLSFFAPQLQAKLDGPHPSSLTPLGSTPQVLALHDDDKNNDNSKRFHPDIEAMQQEPTQHKHTLLGEASEATSTLQRARHRKKQFDKLFTQKSPTPVTDLNKVYTFEFLQHLFNFDDFSIELGSMLGSIKLKEILDGQPLQIMAVCGDQRIWSFDIWHQTLVEEARKHDPSHH